MKRPNNKYFQDPEYKKLIFDELCKIAAMHDGKCLSNSYSGIDNKLLWECKNGHQWSSTPYRIKKGCWCDICRKKENGLKKRKKIEYYQKLAEKNGGKCLSETAEGLHQKLYWECAAGHRWYAEGNSIKVGTWCPKCGRNFTANKLRNTLENINKTACKKGGKCLSSTYNNAHEKLLWQCSNGHKWQAPYHDIQQGQWCPICSEGFGERVCREFFEKIFSKKFPKSYPKWLVTENGHQLELDGYSKTLKLAFEHQGHHHYKNINYFHKGNSFERRLHLDNLKRKLCNIYNVVLIEIPSIPNLTKVDDLQKYIIDECVKNNVIIPQRSLNKRISITRAYSPKLDDKIKDLNEIARKYGGKCLSKSFLGLRVKLKFICKEGHEWEAVPYSIFIGSWCSICRKRDAGIRNRRNIEVFIKFAENKGGKCLSTSYINSGEKLKWECEKGHIWEATPENVMHKNNPTWCPVCKGYYKTIDDMKKIAYQHGGDCLSTKYKGVKIKLQWICSKKHIWESTPDNIINAKQWCPYCSGRAVCEENSLASKNQKLAEQWHPTKNSPLSPNDVTLHSNKKVWWICEKGHEWQAVISSRSNGNNCPYCSNQLICRDNNLSILNPNLAKQWHPTKNGNLTPENYSLFSGKKVWWICEAGHEWQARICDRSRGGNCPYCIKIRKP